MKTHRLTIAGIFFLTCLSISSLAQNNAAKEYFNLGGGITFPMGPYVLGNYAAPGGYALPGSNLNLSFGITPVHFPIGFTLTAGFYSNKYDLDSYLNNHQTPYVSPDFGSKDADVSKLFYKGSYELAGIYKEFSVTNKLAFDVRLLCGDMGVATPNINFYSAQQGNESTWNISANHAHTLSYSLGATMRVEPCSNINISFNIDYMYSDFHEYTVNVLYNSYGSGTNTSSSTGTRASGGPGLIGNHSAGTSAGGYSTLRLGGPQQYSTTVLNLANNGYSIKPTDTTPPQKGVVSAGYQGPQHYSSSSNFIISLLSVGIGVGINL